MIELSTKRKLKEGEYICSKCEGKGIIYEMGTLSTLPYTCNKCNGSGIVDWVEQVVGKPDISLLDSSSYNTFNIINRINYGNSKYSK